MAVLATRLESGDGDLYGKMTDNCLKNVHGCLSVDMMRELAILICIFEGSTFLFDTCPTAIRD